jgi:hypothetical protein
MTDKNPYLALMEDDDEPKKKPKAVSKPVAISPFDVDTSAPRIAPEWATTHDGLPVKDDEEKATVAEAPKDADAYLALMGDEGDHEAGFPYGAANIVGAPGGSLVKNAQGVAESLSGAPPKSIAEMKSLLNPAKVAMTPDVAAKLAAEARTPSIAPLAPLPVEKVPPQTGGQKWLENYANLDRPEFAGGVPEAAQTYQRSKPQGKISSKLYKKFGNQPLNIAGQAAQTAINEDEALMRIRQALYEHQMHKSAAEKMAQEAAARTAQIEREAQATTGASKASGAISNIGKGLAVAGTGLGAYDVYKRLNEGDKTGAALSAGTTGLNLAFPMFGPLSSAALGLYSDPEARKRFIEAMKPGGAWEQRMEGRFGLD